jgi:hypothetical protein
MTKEQIAVGLMEQLLPQFTVCNPGPNSRTPLHWERIRQYTQAAMTIFDDPMHPITIWGYSSAFNPLAFVETILPPNFHYLLQCGQFLIDPTRTVLTQAPVFFDPGSESAQLRILAAYGHPNRWLQSSRDLKRYLYDPSGAILCPADRFFRQHIPATTAALQVRVDGAPFCTVPDNPVGKELAEILLHRAPSAGLKKATLFHLDGQHWTLIDHVSLPAAPRYFETHARAPHSELHIYRLPGREYADHLLNTALGIPYGSNLLRVLTSQLAPGETRIEPIDGILDLQVSSSPYGDAVLAFHVRERTTSSAILHSIYMEASQTLDLLKVYRLHRQTGRPPRWARSRKIEINMTIPISA